MNLIVAVDGSEYSDRALDYALEIAPALDASLTLVHVVDPQVHDLGGETSPEGFAEMDARLVVEGLAAAEERAERVVAEARDRVGGRVPVETELLYGDPVDELAAFAARGDVDGLIIGHRGRTPRHERLVGSVAKELIEVVSVPVTVVR